VTPDQVLALSPVIPVVTIEDAADAAPLAQALFAGGLRTVEITLRTPAALEAIRVAAAATPELVIGAGTVLSAEDMSAAAAAGARYALSPGATPALLRTGRDAPIPLIPGIATASEIMAGLAMSYRCFKFFPAESLGGIDALKAIAGPLPTARFCPTGGISAERVPEYLKLPNVLCVGGSWIATTDLIRAKNWAAIEANARRAAGLKPVA
jgi:2-dehydro-3-deoxyphosphogluconate aldolase / (4S)-4-hydroxy-2-oxoglutarate aldolase